MSSIPTLSPLSTTNIPPIEGTGSVPATSEKCFVDCVYTARNGNGVNRGDYPLFLAAPAVSCLFIGGILFKVMLASRASLKKRKLSKIVLVISLSWVLAIIATGLFSLGILLAKGDNGSMRKCITKCLPK